MGLSAYQRAVLQAGPVGYWPLQEQGFFRQNMAETPGAFWLCNEASGNLADSSGAGLTATKHGSPTYGNVGPMSATGLGAVGFSNVAGQDFFSAGTPAGLSLTGSFTLGAWVNVSSLGVHDHDILTSEAFNASGVLFRVSVGGALLLRTNQAGAHTTLNGIAVLTTQTWYHIIATFDGVTGRVYINGGLDNSGALTAAVANTANFTLSDNSASSLFGFLADAFVIQGRAISAAEAAALYAARTQTDATVSAGAADLSTGAHNGTYTNGPVLGQPAGHLAALAATLNGSTACVSIPSAVTVTDSFTLSAWVNPVSVSPADIETILSLDHGSTQLALLTTGKVRFSANLTGSGPQNMNGTASLVASAWQQVTAVWNAVAGTMTIYINGVQDSQTTGLTGPLSLPSTSRFIGQDNNSIATRFWNGSISDGVVYNKALTGAQVAALFLAGKQGYTGSRYRSGSRANWCY